MLKQEDSVCAGQVRVTPIMRADAFCFNLYLKQELGSSPSFFLVIFRAKHYLSRYFLHHTAFKIVPSWKQLAVCFSIVLSIIFSRTAALFSATMAEQPDPSKSETNPSANTTDTPLANTTDTKPADSEINVDLDVEQKLKQYLANSPIQKNETTSQCKPPHHNTTTPDTTKPMMSSFGYNMRVFLLALRDRRANDLKPFEPESSSIVQPLYFAAVFPVHRRTLFIEKFIKGRKRAKRDSKIRQAGSATHEGAGTRQPWIIRLAENEDDVSISMHSYHAART